MSDTRTVSRRALWIAAGVVVLTAGTLAYVRLHHAPADDAAWTTQSVERGDITARVTASGTLSALVTVQVGSQVSGRIAELYVDYNSPVKKGQLIAKLDPQLFEATLGQARANLLSAQANLAKAKVQAKDAERQAKRAEELSAQGLLSASERDTTRANADAAQAGITAAEASVAQARASVNQAEINLAYTRITSPTDGTVISRSVDVGQTVAASLQTPTLFVIAQDLRQMQVDTSVAESDIGKLRTDMPVTFTVDAWPQERFHGRVRQIRNAATTLQNVVTYDAVVSVDNPDLKLRPGMTTNVTFVYGERKDVLRVPNAALRFRPKSASDDATAANQRGRGARGGDSPQRSVWVLRDGAPVQVALRTGLSDGSSTEVVEGELHEGDLLITAQRDDGDAGKNRSAGPPMRMF